MRAQNAEPETAVRLVRGAVDGVEDPLIPGAWVVDRVDEKAVAEGRIWPQSRGSQLVGHAVGSLPGERTLDLCAAPGGKATMLAGEVVAVEVDEARAERLEKTARLLGATAVRVVHADGRELPPELDGFDRALVDAPCSGLGVLASRPDLRWRAEPLPELQLELLRAAIARVRPGGAVVYSTCTINAEENEAVVDAVAGEGLVDDRPDARRRVAGVPPPLAARAPADAAAPARDGRLLRRPPARALNEGRRRSTIAPWRGATGSGTASRSSRRSTRRTSGGSGSRSTPCSGAGCRVFHFDCGDGHFVPPVTMGPVVLRSIAPGIHAAGGVLDCHLMVDDPVHHFEEFAASGADSVTFHVEVTDDPAAVAAEARAHGLAVGVVFNPETTPARAAAAARAAGADIVLCMSIHPGYSGQAFMPEALGRIAELASLVDVPIQVDGGVGEGNVTALREAGASLFVAGSAIFGAAEPAEAYRRLRAAVA